MNCPQSDTNDLTNKSTIEFDFHPTMEHSIFGVRVNDPLNQISVNSPVNKSKLEMLNKKFNEKNESPTEISFRQLVILIVILE